MHDTSAPARPRSFDPDAGSSLDGLEQVRRSAAFRAVAVAICGVGLAGATLTLGRLAQAERGAGERVETAKAANRSQGEAAAPAARPAESKAAAPVSAAATSSGPSGTERIATASVPPAQPPAALAPTVHATSGLSPVGPAPGESQLVPASMPPGDRRGAEVASAASPAAEVARPAAETARPETARPETPTARRTGNGPNGQAAGPSGPAGQYRAADAPPGSAPGIRAYRFVGTDGRVPGSGARIVTIR